MIKWVRKLYSKKFKLISFLEVSFCFLWHLPLCHLNSGSSELTCTFRLWSSFYRSV